MTKPVYEFVENPMGGTNLKRTDEDGTIWWIPQNESNSDYQAYLESLEKPTANK